MPLLVFMGAAIHYIEVVKIFMLQVNKNVTNYGGVKGKITVSKLSHSKWHLTIKLYFIHGYEY